MAEYIDREVLLEAFDNADADVLEDYGDGTSRWGFGIENILKVINSIPAADVAPVRHGRRVEKEKYTFGIMHDCSLCENRILDNGQSWNYCPFCGAKMDLEELYNNGC